MLSHLSRGSRGQHWRKHICEEHARPDYLMAAAFVKEPDRKTERDIKRFNSARYARLCRFATIILQSPARFASFSSSSRIVGSRKQPYDFSNKQHHSVH